MVSCLTCSSCVFKHDLVCGKYPLHIITCLYVVKRNICEWQTFDITLVGRLVNVVLNGKTVICNQEIPGITGGALDSDEGAPGPLMLQGDHGPVEFRNIILTPAR